MISQTLAATKVLLGERGLGWTKPKRPMRCLEHLRHSVQLSDSLNFALSYLATGVANAPRILLIHGTPGSASGWADFLVSPPANAEVIAVDRPGFGHSGPQRAVVSLVDQAAAIAHLLTVGNDPTIVVGHSLGGAVAVSLAADFPDRVSALVLVAASLDPSLERIHPMQHLGALPVIRHLLPRTIRNANTELMALRPELEALSGKLGQVRAHTFVIHGTHDALVPVANVQFIRNKMKRAASMNTTLLRGRNHFLPWNSAETVRAIMGRAIAASSPTC